MEVAGGAGELADYTEDGISEELAAELIETVHKHVQYVHYVFILSS